MQETEQLRIKKEMMINAVGMVDGDDFLNRFNPIPDDDPDRYRCCAYYSEHGFTFCNVCKTPILKT